jgi:hypothetical protein
METYHVGLIAIAIFVLLSVLSYLSWVSKIRKQEKLLRSPQYLEDTGLGLKAQYVATVFAGRPLDRVIGHGLAHRGNAAVLVSSDGVAIYRTGEASFLIPAKEILGLASDSAVIDRAVEKDGLTSIRWKLGATEVETFLRFVGASERSITMAKLQELVG